MAIKVYNTLTKQKEDFVPINEGKANIYVCGVTPYNHPHVGNARPFVTWDVIRRFLEHEGYDVTHVQNFTDIDDKIYNEIVANMKLQNPNRPLILVADTFNRVVFVSQGYSISLGEQLVKVIKQLGE